ncbi:FAD-binding protein [Clostridium zeae]|uniref:FAD-binding protein n=1 Tax=Clostridium zeae TaxID=2759022 RepID=A0ABQ1E517_9CLOT|nr:FAD-binding oxidoreductase [Clostridium zeae]GFZ29824.1 FAD-binding protein [Clostridium zeae]
MDFQGLTGKVITPSDKEYQFLRLEYNRDINKFPLAIVYCYNNTDVSNAIKWCRKNDISLRIRTGGHNYEGYSTSNGALVVDTTYMNNIEIDEKNDVVKIQAGARLGKVYSELAKKGYAFAGGTCPTVGISGLTLGGGIGLSCRNFGLTTDNLLELEMINAKGAKITANNHENPKLFWACRGAGGGNFGVATSYIFKAQKVNKVTVIELRWDNESREDFVELWQYWLKTADKRISCFAGFNKEGIYLNGFFYGTEAEAKLILKDFLLLPNLLENSYIEYVAFIDAIKAIGAFYDPPNKFKATGRFVYKPLSRKDIRKLVQYIDNSPGTDECFIRLYSLGGAIDEIPNNHTAYYYRKAEYILGITADWKEDNEANEYKNWVEKVFRFVKPLTNGSYVNFPYAELADYGYEYYGKNYYLLKEVKKLYDPTNFFKFQQSIRPY